MFNRLLKHLPSIQKDLEASPVTPTGVEEVSQSPASYTWKPKDKKAMCSPSPTMSARLREEERADRDGIVEISKDQRGTYTKFADGSVLVKEDKDHHKAMKEISERARVSLLETYRYPTGSDVDYQRGRIQQVSLETPLLKFNKDFARTALINFERPSIMMTTKPHHPTPDEETLHHIDVLMKMISGRGLLKIAEDFYMVEMFTHYSPDRMETSVKFICCLPDGTKRYFQGPLNSFVNCKTAEDFVMRALKYGGEA
jgi:hypothetical protein